MVHSTQHSAAKRAPSELTSAQVPIAIQKLERRLVEVQQADVNPSSVNLGDLAESLCNKLAATIVDVFGQDSLEALRLRITRSSFTRMYAVDYDRHAEIEAFESGRRRAIMLIEAELEILKERLNDCEDRSIQRVMKAYDGLELFPGIAEAAGSLFRDGHYANAIEDSVKALNDLVRLKSGVALDGVKLMEHVFSPNNPILRFNELSDETDRDEQKGFMQLFCGAVAGLRNPRAHKLIVDDAERALEFIAFVSLLAKLLQSTKKARRT